MCVFFFFFEIIEGESLWHWPNGNDWVENFVTNKVKKWKEKEARGLWSYKSYI